MELRASKEGYEGFGERLARLRKAHGYTQTEFAERVGTTQRMMTYYESEGGRPPGHLLASMAELLSVSIDGLLGQERLKEAPGPRHSRLWRRLREIEKLPEADRKAVLRFVEALLAKQKFEARSSGAGA
jgi:transcriptional regulator with XRE-family HTH domain